MTNPPVLLTSTVHYLGARTTAGLMQLVLWIVLAGFYFAWNNRANYHFHTPVWPLVALEMGFAVLLFNSLVYLIIPRWLLRGRYGLALVGGLLLLVIYHLWTYAGIQLITAHLPATSDLRQHLRFYYPYGPWYNLTSLMGLKNLAYETLATTLFPILVSFLAYALIVDRRRLAMEQQHLRLELGLLKAQLNPRFLFHTLDQLHAQTLTRDPRAGDVVLHLADLLRYTLYETEAERVPLDRELEFLENYLALERLRYPQITITHRVMGTITTQQLAPLLLHPFYEQLFAGLDSTATPFCVTSSLRVDDERLTLVLHREGNPLGSSYVTAPAIISAQRRLQLHYPVRYVLRLSEATDSWQLELQLDLSAV
jgi:hypothetical protein